MISHVGDGYGLAAAKPMLVGLLTRPAQDWKSGLTAMIDRISRGRSGVVPALRQTPGDGMTFSRRPRCLAERELYGGDDQH